MKKEEQYELPEGILDMARGLVELWNISYEYLKIDVANIINKKITDPVIIEHCLDNFLNVPTDKSYKLLQKLCEYYKKIDEDGAEFYLEEYRITYGIEDEPKVKNKTKKKDYKK